MDQQAETDVGNESSLAEQMSKLFDEHLSGDVGGGVELIDWLWDNKAGILAALASHDALVKALEQMLATIDFYRQINPTITINQSEIGEARAALKARAKEQGGE